MPTIPPRRPQPGRPLPTPSASEFVRVQPSTVCPPVSGPIIQDARPVPLLPLDTWFKDLFTRLWKQGVKPNTQPRGNFLAQTRVPTGLVIPQRMVAPVNPTDKPPDTAYLQGVANDWAKIPDLKRVNAYGFRGDKRTPTDIKTAGGFHPPSTRNDDGYIGDKVYKQFCSYMMRRFQIDLATRVPAAEFVQMVKQTVADKQNRAIFLEYIAWREILKSEELHLGRMIANELLKGYISTTYSPVVARKFAIMNEGKFIYCMRVKGAFVVPEKASKDTWTQVYDECELAQPGPVLWPSIIAYKQLNPPELYFRRGFEQENPLVFTRVRANLS